MSQLALFAAAPAVLIVPPVICRAFDYGATLAVSVSGGKDGQAMLLPAVAVWFRQPSHSADDGLAQRAQIATALLTVAEVFG